MNTSVPLEILDQIAVLQRGEITEYLVYMNISKRMKDVKNKAILESIALQEKSHHDIWEKITNKKVHPNRLRVFLFSIMNIIFGFTFTLKIMERGEDKANKFYLSIQEYFPIAAQIALEEDQHEHELINMLDEERLQYVGSMVLGLSDALVELTGTLAGLTFAFANNTLIVLSGLITGIAASLSMASSEYLSAKAEKKDNAFKSALYTGIAYILTVALMILPYLLIPNLYVALGVLLFIVVFIIFFFNFYISVAQDLPFKKRFLQMVFISLGVAAISFGIGVLIKSVFGIEI
jgi:VIT1/CCC1 family predicted Fe2+/Mn2+ transporter